MGRVGASTNRSPGCRNVGIPCSVVCAVPLWMSSSSWQDMWQTSAGRAGNPFSAEAK